MISFFTPCNICYLLGAYDAAKVNYHLFRYNRKTGKLNLEKRLRVSQVRDKIRRRQDVDGDLVLLRITTHHHVHVDLHKVIRGWLEKKIVIQWTYNRETMQASLV